jgi:hypothetical protein
MPCRLISVSIGSELYHIDIARQIQSGPRQIVRYLWQVFLYYFWLEGGVTSKELGKAVEELYQ